MTGGDAAVPGPGETPAVVADTSIVAQRNAVAAYRIDRLEFHAAPEPEACPEPVRVGTVPPLASAFQPRPEVRGRIERARAAHAVVVLTGGGGMGKSQLAAAYAHQARASLTDVVVWVNATETEQVVAAYAVAARRVRAPGASGQDADNDARAFLDWLAVTSRSWLVVLDDLTGLEAVAAWWPPQAAEPGRGRVLATTRRRDALVSGGGRAVVEVGTYTPAEALDYLRDRFAGARMDHLLDERSEALAEELGRLPLALAHAAAYMVNEDLPCGSYLPMFTDRRARLESLLPPGADTEGYGRPLTAALLLTLDAALACEPVGLAAAAIRLAAWLDPAGHPQALWTTAAFTGYLAAHRTAAPAGAPDGVRQEEARAVLRLLHRYGLLVSDSRDGHRAVRLHALTSRAVRETVGEPAAPPLVRAVADALAEIWPGDNHAEPALSAVLRSNTDTLAAHAGDMLWKGDCHRVLTLAGESLMDVGLYPAAVRTWRRLARDSQRLLGGEHPDTLAAWHCLSYSYKVAGLVESAVGVAERVVEAFKDIQGGEHPDTLIAELNLANCYWLSSRTAEAIAVEERVVATSERVQGRDHPDTLNARQSLAVSYRRAGHTAKAIALMEQDLPDAERVLGTDHSYTLAYRCNLAIAYLHDERTADAIALLERVVGDSERVLGAEHPDTLNARQSLAASYRAAGRTGEAVAIGERVVADRERVLGPDHPNTLISWNGLAYSYREAGRVAEAIAIEEPLLPRFAQVLGADHVHTLTARCGLAASYRRAGRAEEAVTLLEGVAADYERVVGGDHPDALICLGDLAASYREAGRAAEAVALQERVAAGSQRVLGAAHPRTAAAAATLRMWQGGP